jgi:hypothetical protein
MVCASIAAKGTNLKIRHYKKRIGGALRTAVKVLGHAVRELDFLSQDKIWWYSHEHAYRFVVTIGH